METKAPYTLELGGDLDKVSQETYDALQKAITRLVEESGARWFRIGKGPEGNRTEDSVVRTLFVNDSVAP